MPHKNQLGIKFEPDAQQRLMMIETLANHNAAIASEGTDRHEIWSHLVRGGFAWAHECEAAGGVTQFSVNQNGRNFLEQIEGIA